MPRDPSFPLYSSTRKRGVPTREPFVGYEMRAAKKCARVGVSIACCHSINFSSRSTFAARIQYTRVVNHSHPNPRVYIGEHGTKRNTPIAVTVTPFTSQEHATGHSQSLTARSAVKRRMSHKVCEFSVFSARTLNDQRHFRSVNNRKNPMVYGRKLEFFTFWPSCFI